ncbi:aminoglycoside 3-N-acetyltransferase [uncultured Paracoccus sp.]|uniref:aminoglycoside 3-N-acetyltransferase n=1 Tax=uncultured Paracoccus sp. TaxID=189685 RepID=UPI0026206115|nr:aminoglycoside 3-N-acetyltransferase [uncultured Paracoccus sp.]
MPGASDHHHLQGLNARELVGGLHDLGVRPGDTLMVHTSLKALGPVTGGAETVARAILDAVGPGGTVMAYCAWDRSPYEETLNGAILDPAEREAWPAFDPATAGTYRGFGLLNEYLRKLPSARRSAHPDASMVAAGANADHLVRPHEFGAAFGPGSPLDRFRAAGGRVLLLGAPLDAVTVLHLAEALADIPRKRRVSYEMPILEDGRKVWRRTEEFDSNGILDGFAVEGEMDAVETIARLYVSEGHGIKGRIGGAQCHLLQAADIVDYGVRWLERLFGPPGG